MEVVIERACGMDIHKDNITACILTSKGKEIQTFSTKTVFLLQLIDWIKQHECTHVAMESTGVFWKPIVNLLEAEGIEFLVVNAQHMKALPGRKTDVKDSEWIAKLLRHGLLKASFIPDRNQRELRELVRYRRSIIEERARQHNRIQKVLEGANIKLGSVVSDIMGVSSRDMLRGTSLSCLHPVSFNYSNRRTTLTKVPSFYKLHSSRIGLNEAADHSRGSLDVWYFANVLCWFNGFSPIYNVLLSTKLLILEIGNFLYICASKIMYYPIERGSFIEQVCTYPNEIAMFVEDGNPNAWRFLDWAYPSLSLVHMSGWHMNAYAY